MKLPKLFLVLCLLPFLLLSCDAEDSSSDSNSQTEETDPWQKLDVGTTVRLFSVDFVDANRGFVCGRDGFLSRTRDGGSSWQTLTTGTLKDLNDCGAFGNTLGVVGEGGTVLISQDGGNSFIQPTFDTSISSSVDLYGIDFTSETKGVLVGITGTVYYTIDKGSTWKKAATSFSGTGLRGVSFYAGSDKVIVVGGGGKIWYSTDGGNNWTERQAVLAMSHDLYAVHYVTPSVAYACGSVGYIYKTEDGGANWKTAAYYMNVPYFYDVYFLSASKGYAIGEQGGVLYTEDGDNFESRSSTNIDEIVFGVHFVSETTGYLVGGNGAVYKTTTGGTNK